MSATNSGAEIERKFLAPEAPVGSADQGTEILQGYLAVSDETELRVRLAAETAFLTFKGPRRGSVRLEWEQDLPLEIAEELLRICQHGSLHKTRYPLVGPDGHLWAVDVFHGRLAGLVVAEVELKTPDETVELPDWVQSEVTDDDTYYNKNLAKNNPLGKS